MPINALGHNHGSLTSPSPLADLLLLTRQSTVCFTGDNRCFLFSISPSLAVFINTGYNDHYMYFNHGQQTMPNGLVSSGKLEATVCLLTQGGTHPGDMLSGIA